MTSNPSNISHTSINIIFVNIKDILDGSSSAQKVTTSGVNDTLGSTSRARGVEQEEGILSTHLFIGTDRASLLHFLVPPEITVLHHRDTRTSTLVNNDMFHLMSFFLGQ